MKRKTSLFSGVFVLSVLVLVALIKFSSLLPIPALAFDKTANDEELIRRALQAKEAQSLTPTSVLKQTMETSPLDGEEIILGINLGKNRSFLAGFEKANGRLISVSQDLASLRSLSSTDLPGIAQKGISIEEEYDNKLGGFEQTTWQRIFRIDENNAFQQVFAHVKKSEYYWHDAWENSQGPYWHKVNEENTFERLSPDVIIVHRKVTRFIAPGDPKVMPTEYKQESSQSENIRFEWDAATLRFKEKTREQA
ncbi:hypothetical protein GJ688_00910 [Heliobacillus mobilis]|uniref:Uncharacterized protein n=1 Tax=Heliobacterium mobile TaxID=28064 RepID=A0A6I3SAS5_HELMO|nr:hypothetical protein [Heliobacterium mobile]MTV47537.1 hypothetical protein [Heliobacterium mobile]